MSNPWDNEPNQLTFDECGIKCEIIRAPLGHLCGYVEIPPTHPWFGKSDDWIYENFKVDVHCGLTYAGHGFGELSSPDKWLVGFDCAHANDLVPLIPRISLVKQTYRDIEYVKRQCCKLAAQAVAVIAERN